MGCDGGSIPKREDLVQVAKKPEKVDQTEAERTKWFYCAMSKQVLRPPIVTCTLGFVFNKEVVLKHLLEKSIPDQFAHIKSLKDILTLNLTPNPEHKSLGEKKNGGGDHLGQESPFICPVTGLLVGSNHKFSVLRSCGCVFSDRALRECPSDVCLTCNKPFTKDDIMPLNPDEEEMKVLKQKLQDNKLRAKEKTSKRKASVTKEDNGKRKSPDASSTKASTQENKKQKSSPSLTTTTTTSTTVKVV